LQANCGQTIRPKAATWRIEWQRFRLLPNYFVPGWLCDSRQS